MSRDQPQVHENVACSILTSGGGGGGKAAQRLRQTAKMEAEAEEVSAKKHLMKVVDLDVQWLGGTLTPRQDRGR